MKDELKIRVSLNIGIHNAYIEEEFEFESDDYTLSDWRNLSPDEQQKYLDMIAADYASKYFYYYAEVIENDRWSLRI